jgi:hypothetical protein
MADRRKVLSENEMHRIHLMRELIEFGHILLGVAIFGQIARVFLWC